MTNNLENQLQKIKILICDLDGVFTDGSLYIGADGNEMKRFHVLDGAGVALLKAIDFPLAVISGRGSGASSQRMREIGLEKDLYQGNLAKIEPYMAIKEKYGVADAEIAYVGDDLVDIPLMKRVGVPMAVANALPEVKQNALYVSKVAGGHGAVREIIELILQAQHRYREAVERLAQHTYKDK